MQKGRRAEEGGGRNRGEREGDRNAGGEEDWSRKKGVPRGNRKGEGEKWKEIGRQAGGKEEGR